MIVHRYLTLNLKLTVHFIAEKVKCSVSLLITPIIASLNFCCVCAVWFFLTLNFTINKPYPCNVCSTSLFMCPIIVFCCVFVLCVFCVAFVCALLLDLCCAVFCARDVSLCCVCAHALKYTT